MKRYYIEWSASGYAIVESRSLADAIAAVKADTQHPEGLRESGADPIVINMDESGEYIE